MKWVVLVCYFAGMFLIWSWTGLGVGCLSFVAGYGLKQFFKN